MSLRLKQIESILVRAISQVLSQQMTDPRMAGMVSVTNVKTSSNLNKATVGVSITSFEAVCHMSLEAGSNAQPRGDPVRGIPFDWLRFAAQQLLSRLGLLASVRHDYRCSDRGSR